MSSWKNISKLSNQDGQKRETEFEAEMLALLAQENTPAATQPVPETKNLQSPSTQQRDGIQISVTDKGQTKIYSNLKSVPLRFQQQIMNSWNQYSNTSEPPLVSNPIPHVNKALNRPRSKRFALTLNLLLPGAGQFYLGQPIVGSVYAVSFLACLGAILITFFQAYYEYIKVSTSGEIMMGNNLERLAEAFPTVMFFSLLAIGMLIWIVSTVHLHRSHTSESSG